MSKGHDTPIMNKIKFSEPNPLIPKTTVLPREPINNGSGCAFIQLQRFIYARGQMEKCMRANGNANDLQLPKPLKTKST